VILTGVWNVCVLFYYVAILIFIYFASADAKFHDILLVSFLIIE